MKSVNHAMAEDEEEKEVLYGATSRRATTHQVIGRAYPRPSLHAVL